MRDNNETYGEALDTVIAQSIEAAEQTFETEVSLHNRLEKLREREGLDAVASIPSRVLTRLVLIYARNQRAKLEMQISKLVAQKQKTPFDHLGDDEMQDFFDSFRRDDEW